MQHPLRDYFESALKVIGPRHWWPGETPFEVCVGAILTQNTNWTNVEKAIANLRKEDLLDPKKLYAVAPARLASLIRPAGYFNIKTRRLRSFLKFLIDDYDGDLDRMFSGSLSSLREKLLSVKGIGPETCDSILLYAGNKPVFVVDAYTKRIFVRHRVLSEEADYHEIQEYFEGHFPSGDNLGAGGWGGLPRQSGEMSLRDRGGGPGARPPATGEDGWAEPPDRTRSNLYNEFHALIVNIGKNWCKSREPDCAHCPWERFLPEKPEAMDRRIKV